MKFGRSTRLTLALLLGLLSGGGRLAFAADAPGPLKLWHAYRGAEEDALNQAVAQFTHETALSCA